MKIIGFYQGEYPDADVCDEDYRTLIDYCFAHCAVLSFCYPSQEFAEIEMGRFQPFISRSILPEGYDGSRGVISLQHQCFFRCTEDLRTYLLQKAESLFDWFCCGDAEPVPEDLCFYRKDGTCMFWSCTHEGECAFILRENEPVPEFVSHYGWEKLDESYPNYVELLEDGTTAAFDHDVPRAGRQKARGGIVMEWEWQQEK